MPIADFTASLGAGWSPVDTVRHLTKSMRAVSQGLALPRWLLRVLFGASHAVARSYDAVVADYHGRLRRGGQAGRFAPSARAPRGDIEAHRRVVLASHRKAVEQLARQIMSLTRRQTDTLRLPHPLLGRLALREMFLFVLYHNLHHVHVVARRRGEYFSDDTPLRGA